MRRPPVRSLLLWALLPTCSGCLFVYTREETVRPGEAKRQVEFQSETAAQLFATAVDQRVKGRDAHAGTLAIPFIAYIETTRKVSEAAFYNDEVTACDTDNDGVITDTEAVAYSRRYGVNCDLKADQNVLVQTGFVPISSGRDPYEVFYPRPYATPPELTFPAGAGVDLQTLEQSPHGFRVHVTPDNHSGLVSWKARGVASPAPGAAPAALAVPTGEVPKGEVK